MRLTIAIFVFYLTIMSGYAQQGNFPYQNPKLSIEQRIADLLKRMTAEEKAGQLNQLNGGAFTGPAANDSGQMNKLIMVRKGLVGSMLNVNGVHETALVQKTAVEQSRLGIPLLFAMDVIHGYKTVFPLPLAEACSWEPVLAERSASIAALEASADGLHWTFAPMVDISHDIRWGRVMEGAGEDPYLGAKFAEARVKGFQGNFSERNILACIKHFALYGAIQAGREYAHVDMSRVQAWNYYMEPYKAGVKAGAATVMNGFNVFEGIPVTANEYLIEEVLKKMWGFKGFIVSDWMSYGEMIQHGYAKDLKEATHKGLMAGSMMDMQSEALVKYIPELLKEGKLPLAVVDSAVARVLFWKFKLGLFEDPYKYSNADRAEKEIFTVTNKMESRVAGAKSIILLKNKENVLPIATEKKVGLIGYWAESAKDVYDFWVIPARGHHLPVTVKEGLQEVYKQISYAKGYDENNETNPTLIQEALDVALQSDVVIVNVGLKGDLTGENRSLAYPEIPKGQIALLKALRETGKPIVALISSGRPLVLTQLEPLADAMLQIWILGTEHGRAVADVVSGTVNPAAKTVMSYPYATGQIPVHYNMMNTGRPTIPGDPNDWTTKYRDIPNDPLYPFGFGLSYTSFEYGKLKLSNEKGKSGDRVVASVQVKNTGQSSGEEIVQWYLRDPVASTIRPMKELKGFEKIKLAPGESREVTWEITGEALGFYNARGEWIIEPGQFFIMVGPNSRDVQTALFELF
jgi:beta-glucosidase